MAFEKILGIAACDPKGVMGSKGKLPWHCPEDLKHFSETTLGSPMVMGYRTFLSLPARYFDQRMMIVFSHRKLLSDKNLFFVSSLTEFLALEMASKNLYVIGGAQIYQLFLQENLIEEFLLTRLKKAYEGDTFFPLFLLNGWASSKIQETDTFQILRYFRPLRRRICI
ncbi:MAG: dihydrofolate reductase [Chlamydiales bacterium]|jgi:dihydrofolate reductase|nr:dihydrofolate reductase [Chlamydiales bacterium]